MIKTLAVKVFQNFKCGEIYCYTPTKYTVSCAFCELKVPFDGFREHFREKHLTQVELPSQSTIDGCSRLPAQNAGNAMTTDVNETNADGGRSDGAVFGDEKPIDMMPIHWSDIQEVAVDKLDLNENASEANQDAGKSPKKRGRRGKGSATTIKQLQEQISSDEDNTSTDEGEDFFEIEQVQEVDWEEGTGADVTAEEAIDQVLKEEPNDEKDWMSKNEYDSHGTDTESDFSTESYPEPVTTKKEKEDLPYSCKLCKKRVKTELGLIYHIRQMHKGDKELYAETEGQGVLKCEFCPRLFTTKVGLVGHIAILHNPSSKKQPSKRLSNAQEQKEKKLKTKSLKSKEKKKPKEKLSCAQCGEEFSNKNLLRNHIYKAHTDMSCDICGKVFKDTWSLVDHRNAHTGEQNYKCDECGLAFSTNRQKFSHLRRHRPPQPRICDICGRECRDQGAFSRHMRRHTGERPFKCRVCGKGFFEGYDRNIHEAGHFDNRTHECDICGGAFRHRRALRVHKKSHITERNVVCEICDKRFISEKGLTEHMRMHYKTQTLVEKEEELEHTRSMGQEQLITESNETNSMDLSFTSNVKDGVVETAVLPPPDDGRLSVNYEKLVQRLMK